MNDQPNMPNDNMNDLPQEDDVIHLPPPDDLPEEAGDYDYVDDEPVAEAYAEQEETVGRDDQMNERLERLGGEPAPDITPEEFARLRQSGQIHIDPRGRVRSHRRSVNDAGVSLRKRRAWYNTIC